MLKAFRENFKHLKWILWAVIALFVVFVFVDWGMGTTKVAGSSDVAARVGSARITVGEFQREYRAMEDRYRQMYGPNFNPQIAKALNLPSQAINSLIDRRLFRQEAERLGLSVSDAEVSARVLRMKDSQGRFIFVRDGVFVGEAAYKRMLAGASMTPEAFEAETRQGILLEKLNRFYTEGIFVTDDELSNDFAGRTVKAKIAYVLLPASPVAPSAVTDAEAEAAFKQNAAQYTLPERRRAKYLLVETAKIRETLTVTDQEIAAEYSQNAESYKKGEEIHVRHILYKVGEGADADAKAKAKAEAAMAKLRGGADFAALAKAESEDPGSKANGGDLGSFERGRMVKEFEDAAFGAAPGSLVGPIKTPFGWHVIQVIAKTPERVQPLFEVAASIRARLQEQRAQEEVQRISREISDSLARSGGKPSDDEMRRMTRPGVTFNETELIGRSDAAAGVGAAPAFNEALFALQVGAVSDPVAIGRGEAIVKCVEIRPPGPAAFADVRARVVSDLVRKKQDEATMTAARQAMAPGQSLEDLAAKLGLKVQTPEAFGKNGPIPSLGASRAVLEAAFAASPGETKGPFFIADRGAVVFRLVEKNEFDKAAFEAQKAEARERLRGQKAGRLLQALMNRRRSEARIVINKEVLDRFAGNG